MKFQADHAVTQESTRVLRIEPSSGWTRLKLAELWEYCELLYIFDRRDVNLSGGLDSSTLLTLVRTVQGKSNETRAFTFTCGDSRYDETPWVRQMLERTRDGVDHNDKPKTARPARVLTD